MTRSLTTLLLDVAAWIAPARRREWIEGLRAEAPMAGHASAWAWGAVSTALRARLTDAASVGLVLRLISGGYVLFTGACFALYLKGLFPTSGDMDRNIGVIRTAIELTIADVILLGGAGLAILFSARRPWFNRLGRLMFSLGALFFAWSAIIVHSDKPYIHTARYEIQLVATAMFVIAAIAQLLRRPWLFGPAVLAGFAVLLADWGWDGSLLASALTMTAGVGLLIQSKAPAVPGPDPDSQRRTRQSL